MDLADFQFHTLVACFNRTFLLKCGFLKIVSFFFHLLRPRCPEVLSFSFMGVCFVFLSWARVLPSRYPYCLFLVGC